MGELNGSRPIKIDYQLERNGLGEDEPERSSVVARFAVMLVFLAIFLTGLTAMPKDVRGATKRPSETPTAARARRLPPDEARSIRHRFGHAKTRAVVAQELAAIEMN